MNRITDDLLDDDPLLTPAEVASMFRVDPKTVSRWANSGRIPALKTPGGQTRFRRSVIEALLNP